MGVTTGSQLDAPVVSILGDKDLVLLFDDLAYDPEMYSATLIHCDADWKQSALKNNDFLVPFNEFNIQDTIIQLTPESLISIIDLSFRKSQSLVIMWLKSIEEEMQVM